jgi:aspartate kinase
LSVVREQLVVMKFGGTSVEDAKAMNRTAAIVDGRRKKGLNAIVVVSAMAKVTDQLLAAAAAAGRGDKAGALALSSRLRNRHIDTACELLAETRFAVLQAAVHQEFDALDDLLRGIAAVGELTDRTSDLVVSFG